MLLRQRVRGRRWETTVIPVAARGPRREGDEPMLIAQITDIHLGFEPDNPDELNRQRLDTDAARAERG